MCVINELDLAYLKSWKLRKLQDAIVEFPLKQIQNLKHFWMIVRVTI